MLNTCPKCQRSFPATEGSFCAEDATPLKPSDDVPITADPKDPFVGHKVAGKYELRRIIADGGMGRVYEARMLGEERRVAVKILHQAIAEEQVNIERFKREAETSRAMDHTHIVDVLDFAEEKPAPGRPEGAWYLVMEYLDGDELRTVLNDKKILPLARVVRITAQTAIALDGAHAKGMVHRDLKPDNIFLVRGPAGDQVKVLDFGSVKFTKGQDKGQKLTVMGTTIGSPFYMSPEQAKGLPDLDHRADVWAIGAIVYEATVGKVPFHAPNGPQILFKILGEEPMPPSFANDSAPPELDDFAVRALAKKREQRFQSCGELADALGHAFGLTGDHNDWAKLSEQDVSAKLASLAAAPKPVAPPPPADVKPAAFPIGRPAEGTARPVASPPMSSTDNAGVPDDYNPIQKAPTGLYLGIAGAIVVLIVVLVVALR